MIALVGYTGFVGSNIFASAKDRIDKVYNSKNIQDSFGLNPDVLIYAGMRAEKYLANSNPEADMELVYQAEENIKKINPKKLVLISTIDVLKEPNLKNENSLVDTTDLHPYGLNRYRLEEWARTNYPSATIIRLPGLFGINIKKNFIYDFLSVIPFMLKESVFNELSTKNPIIKQYYELQTNGFYKCINLSENDKRVLKDVFNKLGFTALNFTDSRNYYQFYPLSRLWSDINIAVKKDIPLLHPATEPISAGEVHLFLTGKEFTNEITSNPVFYDFRTIYSSDFGGKDGYFMSKSEVLKDIKEFVERYSI